MYSPTPVPQRSVLRATFLHEHERLPGKWDFLNVYGPGYVMFLPRSKRKKSRVSWVSGKVICFMCVDGVSCWSISRNALHLVQRREPWTHLFPTSHDEFSWVCILLRFGSIFILNSAVFTMPISHTLSPRPFTLTLLLWSRSGTVCFSLFWEWVSYPFLSRYTDKEKKLQMDFQAILKYLLFWVRKKKETFCHFMLILFLIWYHILLKLWSFLNFTNYFYLLYNPRSVSVGSATAYSTSVGQKIFKKRNFRKFQKTKLEFMGCWQLFT